MLVLTRGLNEGLRIGANITVKVVGVRSGQVKLAFEAPRNVEIDRAEIRRQKQAGQRRK